MNISNTDTLSEKLSNLNHCIKNVEHDIEYAKTINNYMKNEIDKDLNLLKIDVEKFKLSASIIRSVAGIAFAAISSLSIWQINMLRDADLGVDQEVHSVEQRQNLQDIEINKIKFQLEKKNND